MKCQTIPVFRIFDETRAREFYLGFLGMQVDWEHRFDDQAPLYMQVSRGELVLHLSEHHGDGTPGSRLFVNVDDLDGLFRNVGARNYRYSRPAIERAPWGDRCFEVTDPFANRILFNEVRPD
ncbi:glyoxalase [Marinobacterium nitratireducens]|uniref:Bleomycin resistance protein n=1 Tax=Marinobacterium nitratireducens TaxID=518897 RepID=A0A917ZG23_9GAMM|nr:glyoxalase superfamily protein [Marinobacterium nitratireducens]GGO81484.1 glyoxalase [Marinobacterium nitratireducens]